MMKGKTTWACGLNGDYQLGLGRNSEAEADFCAVTALDGKVILEVAVGSQHVVALASAAGCRDVETDTHYKKRSLEWQTILF